MQKSDEWSRVAMAREPHRLDPLQVVGCEFADRYLVASPAVLPSVCHRRPSMTKAR